MNTKKYLLVGAFLVVLGFLFNLGMESAQAGGLDTINITSPNGAEKIFINNPPYIITWTSSGNISHVNINFAKTSLGSSGFGWIAKNVPNRGVYFWDVAATKFTSGMGIVKGDDYKIQITSTENSSFDVSDNYFSIVPGSTITVTSPNGGESWVQGNTYKISWKSSGITEGAQFRIDLYKEDKRQEEISDHLISQDDRSYFWTIPTSTSYVGSKYKIRISDASRPALINDSSDNYFKIVPAASIIPASITVLSPNGGEKWVVGSKQKIIWKSAGIPSGQPINIISLKSFAGIEYHLLYDTPNDGSETIIVPNLKPGTYKLYIETMVRKKAIFDSSNNFFKITPAVESSITVLSPNGGEICVKGQICKIKWTAKGIKNLMIGLQGPSSRTILASAPASGGYYSWVVPVDVVESSAYKILIGDMESPLNDQSDNYFSIAATSTMQSLNNNK